MNFNDPSGLLGESRRGLSVPDDQNGNGLADEEEDGLITSGMWDGLASSISSSMRSEYGVLEPEPTTGGRLPSRPRAPPEMDGMFTT